MKYIRRISVIAMMIFVFSTAQVAVFAHSGGTDSKGGHMNHATGQYHYHHGHSAHQHYDIDGDDNIDCPIEYWSTVFCASVTVLVILATVVLFGWSRSRNRT